MTTLLQDLFDFNLFDEMYENGFVTAKPHRRLPYVILNYTPKTQYENVWNDVTRACRGLIYRMVTFEVISRPFDKFFNFDDTTNTTPPTEATQIEVLDKIDGSLGIAYPDPEQPTGVAIATRGSFHSAQAEHATARYQQTHYTFSPRAGWTYLYEIVYPANRIVVDYGQDDNLYLIGVRNIDTGKMLSVRHPHITIPRTTVLKFENYEDFISNWKPRPGIEGVVIVDTVNGGMWKVKTEEYKEIHRITFGMSARTIWNALQSGSFVDYTLLPTPYLQQWALKTAEEILDRKDDLLSVVGGAYITVKTALGPAIEGEDGRKNRKKFAEYVIQHYPDLKHYLFRLVDGRPIDDMVWKAVEPKGDIRPTLVQE